MQTHQGMQPPGGLAKSSSLTTTKRIEKDINMISQYHYNPVIDGQRHQHY